MGPSPIVAVAFLILGLPSLLAAPLKASAADQRAIRLPRPTGFPIQTSTEGAGPPRPGILGNVVGR